MIFAHWCVTRHSHFPLSRELKTWLGKPTPKQTFFRKMTFWMHYFWMRNKLIKAIKFLCPLIISTSPLSAAEKYSRVKFLLAANCRMAVFTLEDALSVQTHNASMAVFILRTHYPTGRTWANICSSSGYASLVWRRAQDALCFWTNFPSKYVLNDALRKVVRLDA